MFDPFSIASGVVRAVTSMASDPGYIIKATEKLAAGSNPLPPEQKYEAAEQNGKKEEDKQCR